MPIISQKTIDQYQIVCLSFGWLGKYNTNIMGRERERERKRERRVTLCVASVYSRDTI